jgi:hypothetical protein
MAHPEIDNQTPFGFEPLFVADEDGRPIVAPIVRATFDVGAGGAISLAEKQEPVNFEGEYYGEPGESSYRYEPETAFVKPATDVVLLGHAYAPTGGTTVVDVEFRVGPVGKWVRVHGDRFVMQSGLMSAAAPFEMMPLTYERAFGGWDQSAENPDHHTFEPWNPVGVGFVAKHGRVFEGQPLPNLEDPHDPLKSVGSWCTPTGVGFVGPNWQPRVSFVGTYDEAWANTRAPLLPKDFDRRFFNAASYGLVAPGYLRGDEPVVVRQATPEGYWAFNLPGVANPHFRIATKLGEDRELYGNLDTVIVDADAKRLVMLWRNYTVLRDGPLDVRAISIRCENMPRVVKAPAVSAAAAATTR